MFMSRLKSTRATTLLCPRAISAISSLWGCLGVFISRNYRENVCFTSALNVYALSAGFLSRFRNLQPVDLYFSTVPVAWTGLPNRPGWCGMFSRVKLVKVGPNAVTNGALFHRPNMKHNVDVINKIKVWKESWLRVEG